MTSWPCVLAHRFEPDRLRPAVEGLLVCRGCLSRLEQVLSELPAQWRGLSVPVSCAASGGRVSGTPEAQLPISPAAAELRSDILWKLVSWVRLVAEDRRISVPTSNEIGVLTGWLLVHLRWACAQSWVEDFAVELSGMRSRAWSLLFPSGRRRVVVGECVGRVRAEGPVLRDGSWPVGPCPGRLVASIAAADSLLPSELACDVSADHVWAPSQWLGLGRQLHSAGRMSA